jgi:hypothetical protein
VLIEDCYRENSSDDGYELNSIMNAVVRRTKAKDPMAAEFYSINIGGMLKPRTAKQHVRGH